MAKAKENTAAEAVAEETPVIKEKDQPKKAGKTVKYCLPYLNGAGPGDFRTVTLNGKNYQVQYGVEVEMPIGVAQILKEAVAQDMLIRNKIKKLQEEKCLTKID